MLHLNPAGSPSLPASSLRPGVAPCTRSCCHAAFKPALTEGGVYSHRSTPMILQPSWPGTAHRMRKLDTAGGGSMQSSGPARSHRSGRCCRAASVQAWIASSTCGDSQPKYIHAQQKLPSLGSSGMQTQPYRSQSPGAGCKFAPFGWLPGRATRRPRAHSRAARPPVARARPPAGAGPAAPAWARARARAWPRTAGH